MANVPSGTALRTVWTIVDAVDANGTAIKDNVLKTVDDTVDSDSSRDHKLSTPSTGDWPVGSYKVDIYLNDKLDRTLNFTVQ